MQKIWNSKNTKEVYGVEMMGIKGLIRDAIMAFVAFELLTNGMDKNLLAYILIAVVVFFTVIGFWRLLS
jgi:hypothetical protein